ncbi:DUF7408 domain-containing protein [Paenibacillus hexagrammi]|uniref:DUF7408 domain-containing protein n=1 Tax=Paenibacillus hexagrammi TaxID=2908839 RepID=A0ABY3SNP3_9BACL|nr:hypothetical protein [Paenibacillus sp. YPD9-1]UJF35098.1 hypothetical protein L0M14_08175 [Paenibacillus sp. YPD9-1]
MRILSIKRNVILKVCTAWLAVAACLQLAPGTARHAAAEPSGTIQIQTEQVFGSGVKLGRWLPVQVTLNNSGEDVSGDLAFQSAGMDGNKDSMFVQHVDLPRGSTKTVTMLLPGMDYSKGNNAILLYRDSLEDGKPIPLEGTSYLETTTIPADTVQVGVLAEDVDTMNFLALLSQNGKKTNIVHLKGSDVPNIALALDNFDVMVLNNFASDVLSQEQVSAIQGWVRRGGYLLLAGGAGYPKTAAPFVDISPVTYEHTESIRVLEALEKLGDKELSLTDSFTISKAAVKQDANVIAATQDQVPLFADIAVGRGEVMYAAYDLALNPMASWNGNPRLWEQILKEPFELTYQANQNQMKFGPGPYWDLSRALEFFQSLKPPRLSILAWVMLVYSVIIGPILYVVLKRMDRREWAWVMIPVLAVAVSAGIFQIGSSSRGSTMAQLFQTLELDGTGMGTEKALLSVFLPKGGSLELQLPGHTHVSPFRAVDGNSSRTTTGRNELVIEQRDGNSRVRIQDVPYSSVSKMQIDTDAPLETGRLEYTLRSLSINGAEGEIINQTKWDMSDVAVIMNQNVIRIGELKAGAKAAFTTAGAANISYAQDAANVVFPYQGGSASEDIYYQQRSMLSSYLNVKTNAAGAFEPMVIGWSKDGEKLSLTNGDQIPTDRFTLITQEMNMNFVTPDGKIVVPSSALVPQITDNHTTMNAIMFQNGPYMQIGSGDMTLTYSFPQISGAVYQKLSLQTEVNQDVKVEIWNRKSQAWESLPTQPELQWNEDKFAPFAGEEQIIRLKVSTVQPNVNFRIPAISLEGTVQS